jgi:hypothetical protein
MQKGALAKAGVPFFVPPVWSCVGFGAGASQLASRFSMKTRSISGGNCVLSFDNVPKGM